MHVLNMKGDIKYNMPSLFSIGNFFVSEMTTLNTMEPEVTSFSVAVAVEKQ